MAVLQLAMLREAQVVLQHLVLAALAAPVDLVRVLVVLQLAAPVALVEYRRLLAALAEKEATVRAMRAQLV